LKHVVAALALLAFCGCGDEGAREECVVDDGTGPATLLDGPLCRYLSSYRLFDDIPSQTAAADLIPYDLNTPLFSDYTDKLRWMWLPGGPLAWSDAESFAAPAGTTIVKTFAMPNDRRDPGAGTRLLETRVLVVRADGWEGASYVHDPETGDAELTSGARTIDVSWIHDDGAARDNAYVVPSKNQCKNCHEEHLEVMSSIGPKARHLNRPGPGAAGVANQLQDLIDRGLLAGAPDPSLWPRAPNAADPATGTVEERARAWLDINCAHCHNPTGPADTSGLDLSLGQTDPFQLGVCKPPVAAGQGSGGRSWGIVPGDPDASILVYRIESIEADIKMPELGRNLIDDGGVALVREWITGMTLPACSN
jgi:uncharacterized repeat protein (TIGR03806 family)